MLFVCLFVLSQIIEGRNKTPCTFGHVVRYTRILLLWKGTSTACFISCFCALLKRNSSVKTVPMAFEGGQSWSLHHSGTPMFLQKVEWRHLSLHIGLVAVTRGLSLSSLQFGTSLAVTQWAVSVPTVSFVFFLCEKDSCYCHDQ